MQHITAAFCLIVSFSLMNATCHAREKKTFSVTDISRYFGSSGVDASIIKDAGVHIVSDEFAISLRKSLHLTELPRVRLISDITVEYNADDSLGSLAFGISIESDSNDAIDSILELTSIYVKSRLIGFSHKYANDLIFGESELKKVDSDVNAICEKYYYVNPKELKELSSDSGSDDIKIFSIEDNGFNWEFFVHTGTDGEVQFISERKTRVE